MPTSKVLLITHCLHNKQHRSCHGRFLFAPRISLQGLPPGYRATTPGSWICLSSKSCWWAFFASTKSVWVELLLSLVVASSSVPRIRVLGLCPMYGTRQAKICTESQLTQLNRFFSCSLTARPLTKLRIFVSVCTHSSKVFFHYSRTYEII